MIYSGLLRELASYGFLVVALNHNDQTCMHTRGPPVNDSAEDVKPKILGNKDGPIQIKESKADKTKKNHPYDALDREKVERRVIKFDKSKKADDIDYSRLQMEIREAELDHLLSEMFEKTFLSKSLGFVIAAEAGIDTSKLVVMGHQLGGLAALSVSAGDKRVKIVITLDPWFTPYNKEVQLGKFNIKDPN